MVISLFAQKNSYNFIQQRLTKQIKGLRFSNQMKDLKNVNYLKDSTYNLHYNPASNSWIDTSKYIYSYDVNHRLSDERGFNFASNGTWDYVGRITHWYDSNGDDKYDTCYYNMGYMLVTGLVENTYNINHKLVDYKSKTLDQSMVMVNDKWGTFTFNGNGTVNQELIQTWDVPSNSWINWNKYIYTYDNNQYLIGIERFYWYTYLNIWYPAPIENITNDVNGNPIFIQVSTTDYKLFHYDNNNNLIDYTYYAWDASYNDTLPTYWELYYWSSITNMVDLKNDYGTMIYPTITSDKITIVSEIENMILNITDINGQIVIERKLEFGNNEISVLNLKSGIYIIKTLSKSGISTNRIVKL